MALTDTMMLILQNKNLYLKQSNSRVSCIKYFGLRSNKTMRQNNRNLG